MHDYSTPDSGFTLNPRTGDSVSTGYAVATYPELSACIPRVATLSPAEFDAAFTAYAAAYRVQLTDDRNMMGGWNDPETGDFWFDISTVCPTEQEARDLSIRHNQIAYFDILSGESVTTGGTGLIAA